jgi:hypothetical protein
VTEPVAGDGTGASVATQPENDFHEGYCQPSAVQIDASAEYVRYQQEVAGTDDDYANINFTVGTVDFFFKPAFDETDGKNHFLFVALSSDNSGFRMRKAALENNNNFQFTVLDEGALAGEAQVAPDKLPFTSGTWVRITVTWDFSEVMGQQVHVYFDGAEATYVDDGGTVEDIVFTGPVPETDEYIWIGNSPDGALPANGMIDDFKIYSAVVTPG